jgi:hypothetical protein
LEEAEEAGAATLRPAGGTVAAKTPSRRGESAEANRYAVPNNNFALMNSRCWNEVIIELMVLIGSPDA